MHIIWQDIIFSIGGFIFSIALIPTIRAKEKPAVSSSAMTGSILAIYLICYATLHLWLAFISGILTTICWFILMIQAIKKGNNNGITKS